jgi:hypothetical protein
MTKGKIEMISDKMLDNYFKSGKKITQCPTINNQDDRVKTNKSREPRDQQPRINSSICDNCINNKETKRKRKACIGICNPLLWINGNADTQEVLISDLHDINQEYKDYKEVINEIAEDIELKKAHLKKIFDIEDERKRAMAILIYVGKFDKAQIAKYFHLSASQIYRLTK